MNLNFPQKILLLIDLIKLFKTIRYTFYWNQSSHKCFVRRASSKGISNFKKLRKCISTKIWRNLPTSSVVQNVNKVNVYVIKKKYSLCPIILDSACFMANIWFYVNIVYYKIDWFLFENNLFSKINSWSQVVNIWLYIKFFSYVFNWFLWIFLR